MKKTRVWQAFVAGLVVVVVGLVTAAAAARPAATSATGTAYADAAGDSTGAPDLTAVSVANDPVTGLITVSVTAVGFAASTAPEAGVIAYLNTDLNFATGDNGFDYSLFAVKDTSGFSWDVEHWDGSEWQSLPQTPTMNYNRSGDVLSWTVGKADLAAESGFVFDVFSVALDSSQNPLGTDRAPDGGVWMYTMTTAPPPQPTTTTPTPAPPPVAVKPVIGPAIATAAVSGKRMTVRFNVTRSDTGGKLTAGTLICDPSVAGKVIPHSEQFKSGVIRMSFIVPRTAKGKLLKVRVTIRVNAKQSTTRIATFRVK